MYRVILIAITLIAVGCGGTKPSRFYKLSAQPVVEEPGEARQVIAIDLSYFPDYLNRPQIVAYASDHEIVVEEYDRWAEPLEENFVQSLLLNISSLRPQDVILAASRVGVNQPDMKVTLRIERFDITADATTTLEASWEIASPSGITRGSAKLEKSVTPAKKGYAQHVAGLSDLVMELAREISAALDAAGTPRDGQ